MSHSAAELPAEYQCKPILTADDVPALSEFPLFRSDLATFVDASHQTLRSDIDGPEAPPDTTYVADATRLPFGDIYAETKVLKKMGYGIHLIGDPSDPATDLRYFVDQADVGPLSVVESHFEGHDMPAESNVMGDVYAAISDGDLRRLGNIPTVPKLAGTPEPLAPIPGLDPEESRVRALMSGTLFAAIIGNISYRETLPLAMERYELLIRRGHKMFGPEELESMAARIVQASLQCVPDLPPPASIRGNL